MHIIGISGGSGSGKTSLLRALRERFLENEVALISQDDYYHPVDRSIENHHIDFDRPEALDLDRLAQDILNLKNGGRVKRMEYTFNNAADKGSEIEIAPAPVLLVEGLFVMCHEDIRTHCDQLVYVEAETELRFQRRLHRDMVERGYSEESIKYKWENQVEPGFKTYLEPHRALADFIVDSNESIGKGVEELVSLIEGVLE